MSDSAMLKGEKTGVSEDVSNETASKRIRNPTRKARTSADQRSLKKGQDSGGILDDNESNSNSQNESMANYDNDDEYKPNQPARRAAAKKPLPIETLDIVKAERNQINRRYDVLLLQHKKCTSKVKKFGDENKKLKDENKRLKEKIRDQDRRSKEQVVASEEGKAETEQILAEFRKGASDTLKRSATNAMPDDDVRSELEEIEVEWGRWAKDMAVESLSEIDRGLLDEVIEKATPAPLNKEESDILYQKLTSHTAAPRILLNIAIAYRMSETFFQGPFKFAGTILGPGKEILERNLDIGMSYDNEMAQQWRQSTMQQFKSALDDDSSKANGSGHCTVRGASRDFCVNLATKMTGDWSSLLKFKSRTDEARRYDRLIIMIQRAGDFSVRLWAQRVRMQVLHSWASDNEDYRFHQESEILTHDRSLNVPLEDGSYRYEGGDVRLVVVPAILAFGNEKGENYHESRVWLKARVWLWPKDEEPALPIGGAAMIPDGQEQGATSDKKRKADPIGDNHADSEGRRSKLGKSEHYTQPVNEKDAINARPAAEEKADPHQHQTVDLHSSTSASPFLMHEPDSVAKSKRDDTNATKQQAQGTEDGRFPYGQPSRTDGKHQEPGKGTCKKRGRPKEKVRGAGEEQLTSSEHEVGTSSFNTVLGSIGKNDAFDQKKAEQDTLDREKISPTKHGAEKRMAKVLVELPSDQPHV